MAASLDPG